jgi:predicted membrane-bound mannosyltransferase
MASHKVTSKWTRLGIIVAALTALLYAVTMPIAFPTEDAATQLAMVEQGDWQWEPGHILALPLLHLSWYRS